MQENLTLLHVDKKDGDQPVHLHYLECIVTVKCPLCKILIF